MDIKIRPDWTIPQSVFRSFRYDTEEQLVKCFEFDYENTRISRIVKDEVDRINLKKLLQENYLYLKAGYKFYSS